MAAFICMILWCIFTVTMATLPTIHPRSAGSFDALAYQYLTTLSDVSNGGLGSRVTNTKDEKIAAEYISSKLSDIGYE
ncbi:hypothetical protein SARC_14476, partial [Sphaeroforma arctica JP610]